MTYIPILTMMKYDIFDSLLDGVVVVDETEGLVYCNKALSGLLSLPFKRIKLGAKLDDYMVFFPKLYKPQLKISCIR